MEKQKMTTKRTGKYNYVDNNYHEVHKKGKEGKRRTFLEKTTNSQQPIVDSSSTSQMKVENLDRDPVYEYADGKIPRGSKKCRKSHENEDGFYLMYDSNCQKCAQLEEETLRKIAIVMKIEGIDQYTTKDSLCRKIARELFKPHAHSMSPADKYIQHLKNIGFSNKLNVEKFFKAEIEKGRFPLFGKNWECKACGKNNYGVYKDECKVCLWPASTDAQSISLIKHLFEKKRILSIIPSAEAVFLFKETEKYVETFSEFKEIWEQEKEEMWNSLYIQQEVQKNAFESFAQWVTQRNLINAMLTLKKTYPEIPKDLLRLIAFQTMLGDCDNDDVEKKTVKQISSARWVQVKKWINDQFDKLNVKEHTEKSDKKYFGGFGYNPENSMTVREHPLIGRLLKDDVFIYTPPTLKLYGLAQLLKIKELMNPSLPISRALYCKLIKERIGAIATAAE